MREKLSTRQIRSTNELSALADKCAKAEEGRTAPELAQKALAEPETPVKKKSSRKRDSTLVLAAEQGPPAEPKKAKPETGVAAVRPAAGPWCPIDETSSHDAGDCRSLQ